MAQIKLDNFEGKVTLLKIRIRGTANRAGRRAVTDIHAGSRESRRTDFQTDGIYQRKPGTCADHRKGDGGAVGIQGRGPDCKVGLS